ncbi:MAG: ATP-binding cassette domain-containing protein, partial [Bacteroidota bacterium]
MIEVSNLSCGYQAPVLERVSFALKPGEFLGVVGANGTGKSTLLKTLYGLLKPLGGS